LRREIGWEKQHLAGGHLSCGDLRSARRHPCGGRLGTSASSRCPCRSAADVDRAGGNTGQVEEET
jgi:hypothetical protein